MTHAHVRVSQLRFAWPDGTPVFEDLSFTLGAQRTGLVAPNGAGKSTLMRLLAGQLAPASGRVEIAGNLAYLPQQLTLSGALRVAEVLGVADRLDALAAIASGRLEQTLFDTVGDDWDLEERTRATLARLGLDHIALDRRLGSLSGGEVMAVGLAAQWLKRPDVLLLDEPSNHLDGDARHRLYRLVDDWDGCLLVASHDRSLLERMDQIAELDRSALRLYGGGFAFYEDATRVETEAAEQEVRGLRQALKREQRERQQARERTERRAGNAARNLSSAGLSRIVAGNRKRAAQVSAARSDDVHSARVVDAQQRLVEARRGLRDTPELRLELPATEVPPSRLLLRGQGLQVVRDGRALFASDGVDLQIRGPSASPWAGPTALARPRCCSSSPAICHRTPARCNVGRAASRCCRSGWMRWIRMKASQATSPAAHRNCPMRNAATCSRAGCSAPMTCICRCRPCPAANACVPAWPACCTPRRHRSCWCWTSRPTTSTWTPCANSKARCVRIAARWWWSATTMRSSITSRRRAA